MIFFIALPRKREGDKWLETLIGKRLLYLRTITNFQKLFSGMENAIRQNEFIHRYVMAIDHALLWIAALSFAAYFHLSLDFTKPEALLFSTLVAYGAYLCESGLETLKTAASLSSCQLDFRKAGLWKWIFLNIVANAILSLLFLSSPAWIYLVLIILTAGWQKYMDGRIPPRLQATCKPIIITTDKES